MILFVYFHFFLVKVKTEWVGKVRQWSSLLAVYQTPPEPRAPFTHSPWPRSPRHLPHSSGAPLMASS